MSKLLPTHVIHFHLQHDQLFHDAKLRARHFDAIEKACEAVRNMPATRERVYVFEKAYDDAMNASKPQDERSKENDRLDTAGDPHA